MNTRERAEHVLKQPVIYDTYIEMREVIRDLIADDNVKFTEEIMRLEETAELRVQEAIRHTAERCLEIVELHEGLGLATSGIRAKYLKEGSDE